MKSHLARVFFELGVRYAVVADAIQSSGYFTSLDTGLAGHWLKVQEGRLENRVT